jgi:uncharacterized protein
MSQPVSAKATAAKTVKCPNCGGPSLYFSDNPYRPFCSARCKNIDFGAWASESYRVASQTPPDDSTLSDATGQTNQDG